MSEEIAHIVAVPDRTNQDLYAAVKCMEIVINNDIPSPEDVGFLFMAMSELNKFQTEEDEEKFTLRLTEKYAVGIWHCLNIVVANRLVTDPHRLAVILPLQQALAVELDKVVLMNTSPVQVQEYMTLPDSQAPYSPDPNHPRGSSKGLELLDLDPGPGKTPQPSKLELYVPGKDNGPKKKPDILLPS